MDRAVALDQLPDVYAAALRLQDQGHDPASIADTLRVDPAGMGALLDLAEAKLARILTDDPTGMSGHHTPGTMEAGEPG